VFLKNEGKTLGNIDMEYRNDALNFLWEMNEKYQERVKKLWSLYQKSEDEKNKVSILAEIRKQEQQHFDNLQSLGITPKIADKHIHGLVYISKLGAEEKKDEKIKLDNTVLEHIADNAVIN
jgi:hypothetical protein